MNIFKGLLFLEGYLVDPRTVDDAYGPVYGTHADSARRYSDTFAKGGDPEPDATRASFGGLRSCDATGCG